MGQIDRDTFADADEDVLQTPALFVEIMDVPGGDDRQAGRRGRREEGRGDGRSQVYAATQFRRNLPYASPRASTGVVKIPRSLI